ncbi:hypothetical protein ACNHYB_13465 [Isoptericola jiangsuensis]|uniref:hypothetical protein n=1 Tax=Isoptericola jiangsuensis TaxID=548579 RepID=UPI003AB06164
MDARDEAFDRLTGADPADGTETREGVLRAKVDAMIDAPGTADGAGEPGAGAVQGAAPGTTADDLAVRRRRRVPLLVAAVVAGAVVVGGGGYAVGSATAGGEWSGQDALPPITLGGGQGGAEGGGRGAAADGPPATTDAAGGAVTESRAATGMAYPGWFDGRATFDQQGLATSGAEATAYAYDATSAATEANASEVAAALGVDGEPRWEHGSWAVGPQDGDGPSLWLSVDPSASFSYNDPGADPWRCEEAATATTTEGGATGAASDAVEPAPACAPPEGQVSGRAAVEALSATMESLGVDPGRFEFEPAEEGEGSRWVSASEVVDGRRTGAAWSATVSEDGVAWLDGFLATTVELGTYPVISPAEAVERLADVRFGQNAWPVTYGPAAEARLMAPGDERTEPDEAPAPPSAGADLPWDVSDVTITDARLGLAQEYREGQATLLLPAYELGDAEGNVWTVVAVAQDALDMTGP